jgi:hypothetical protein
MRAEASGRIARSKAIESTSMPTPYQERFLPKYASLIAAPG